MKGARLRCALLAAPLLLCIGAGLISIALPEEPESPGYYDGDGDDAFALPERLETSVVLADTPGPLLPPVLSPAPAPLTMPAAPPRLLPPGRSQPPPLRSPPA